MKPSEFIRQRRAVLDISQADLAHRLSEYGQETSPARVGHWETERNKLPLHDKRFREALAMALEMDINQLLSEIEYTISDDQRSKEALLAAMIVDRLPKEAQDLALDYLEVLEKRFVRPN